MKKTDILILLKAIQNYYPNFKFDGEKRDFWHEVMRGMDFEQVKLNLVEYVKTSKFPPTIADLAVKKMESRKSDFLKLAEEWERDAVDKPRS